MSSRTQVIGLLVGLSAAVIACGAEPTSSSSPRINGSGGSGNSTSSTAGTGDTGTGNTGNVAGTTDPGAGGTVASTGGTGDPGASGSVGIAGTTGSGTAGSTGADPCLPIDSLKALPLAVDGPFIPGGYFFDPQFPENANGIIHAACDSRPDATAVGSCHKWSFTPMTLGLDPTTNMMITYGGVFWLAGNASNWGTGPGVNVAPGAQTVKFKAWGAAGGEVITFSVGGVVGTTCLDNVSFGTMGALKQTLSTTPTDYVINLAGQTYPKGVIGGFSWSTENASTTTPVTFMVDDIRWTTDAS